MCGITGWFSTNRISAETSGILDSMLDSIRHRGPDESGIVSFPYASLGHVRLSIIDLSSGQQPMTSHDQRYTIIFNGEIYNYKDLQKTLKASGHKFLTHSDTEVILEIYRKYGVPGFSKLRGMYSFAIWDNLENTGILARDPLGIKPLFYHVENDRSVTFGSEAKPILVKLNNKPVLDISQLHLLMNFRYIIGNGSMFKGIEQLPPGKVLKWTPGQDFQLFNIDLPSSNKKLSLDHIRDSVEKHLTADVEVGCYLSGGIDSATIAALSKQQIGNSFRTFTLDVGDDPEEATFASETAHFLKLKNIKLEVSPDISNELKQLIWHLEAPKINSLQNWLLAKLTSSHVKVTLSGLGGDELFYGYNMHKILDQTFRISRFTPSFASKSLGSLLSSLFSSISSIQWSEKQRAFEMLKQLGNWSTVYGLVRNVWDTPEMRKLIYGERVLDENLPNAFSTLENLWPENEDPVTSAAQFEWRNKMVNDLLWQEDRVSMAHGLEVRTPFVDSTLYSHQQVIPRKILMENSNPKAYLKKLVSPILTKNILDRPKSGFQVSSPHFFHSHLKHLSDDILSKDQLKKTGLFNHNFIQHVLKFKPEKRLRWHYFIIYLMLMTELWVDTFENNFPSRIN